MPYDNKSRQFPVKHDRDLKYRPPETETKFWERGMRCENFNFCKTDRGNVEIMGEETGSRCKN